MRLEDWMKEHARRWLASQFPNGAGMHSADHDDTPFIKERDAVIEELGRDAGPWAIKTWNRIYVEVLREHRQPKNVYGAIYSTPMLRS